MKIYKKFLLSGYVIEVRFGFTIVKKPKKKLMDLLGILKRRHDNFTEEE